MYTLVYLCAQVLSQDLSYTRNRGIDCPVLLCHALGSCTQCPKYISTTSNEINKQSVLQYLKHVVLCATEAILLQVTG